jgi:hypothetical protein
MTLKKVALCVRIYVSPTRFTTKNIGRQVGNKIGETLLVDLDEDTKRWRDYLCIRIKLDIEKPLTRVVYISMGKDGQGEAFRIRYGKLPMFWIFLF